MFQSHHFLHPGRIACCSAPNSRPPATKALHTICGNNASIVSSYWWWAYKYPKHVEQTISTIQHSVASSWFSSLRSYYWMVLGCLSIFVLWEMNFWCVTRLVASFNTVPPWPKETWSITWGWTWRIRMGTPWRIDLDYETWAWYTALNCVGRISEVHTFTWVVQHKQRDESVKKITFIVRSQDSADKEVSYVPK